MSKRKPYQKAHGLAQGERYALLPERVVQSEAYCSLTASALRLLSLALCKFNGSNNGDISLTQSALKIYGFTSNDTFCRAIKQLLGTGLLVLTRQGGFAQGGKKPNLYAFGWLPIPENPKLVEISTPCEPPNGWASFKLKPSPDRSVLPNPDSCAVVTPISATKANSSPDGPDWSSTDVPDTFLRSSPEGHHSGGPEVRAAKL